MIVVQFFYVTSELLLLTVCNTSISLFGPFCGAIAVPSVTRCHFCCCCCCCGHRF